jgi:Spy/CpxP family protein refolding chaperone
MRIRNLVLTALVASFAFAAAAPAFAYDDWRWHERHERHEWQEREARQQAWREHHWRQQSYAPAPGYYAPPPPPYYGNPGYYR